MTEQFTPPTSEWYHPTDDVIANAHIPDYEEVYKEAMSDIEGFWAERADELEWYKKWDKVLDDSNKPFYKWFEQNGSKVTDKNKRVVLFADTYLNFHEPNIGI